MYFVRNLLTVFIYGIPLLLGLVFVVGVLRKGFAPLKELFGRWKRGLPMIVAVTLVCGLLAGVYQLAGGGLSSSFRMGYNYANASKGLNPNGTLLDVGEVLSDEVLSETIAVGGYSLTPDELREALRVGDTARRDSLSMENAYISTEYEIIYEATAKTAGIDSEELLSTLAKTYQQYFAQTYGRKTNLLEQDYSVLDELDYLDISEYLSSYMRNVIDYMDMCEDESATFVSAVTSESFGSIAEKATNFRDVTLERFEAYVLKYGVSKNASQYISRLNYENRMSNVSYMKSLASYNVRLSAISMYDGDITKVVLVPSRDSDGEFYQSRTKIGTDYFADEANEHLQNAVNRQNEIQTNNYYIECLSAANTSSTQVQEVEQMVAQMKQDATEICQLAIQTVQDFDARNAENYVTFSVGGSKSLKDIAFKAGFYMAVIFALASAAAVVTEKLPAKNKPVKVKAKAKTSRAVTMHKRGEDQDERT